MSDDQRPRVTISMQDLMGLAGRQLRAADEVTAIEELLGAAKKKHAYIEQELMPAAMRELELSEITLNDGRILRLEPKVSAQISEENAPAAFEWLTDHGFEGVIKNLVAIEFGKGEDAMSQDVLGAVKQKLLEIAKQYNLPVEEMLQKVMQKRTVHPQTLLKVMRDTLSEGESPPEDVFNLWLYDQVKLKAARK